MPIHSKHAGFFKCKILKTQRKDGEYRYRINLPKSLVESVKRGHPLHGRFELDPTTSIITFYKNEKKEAVQND